MSRARIAPFSALLIAFLVGVVLIGPAASQTASAPTPKSGGVLNMMLREDLSQGFAIHETSTISTVWPSMPCFNNLVVFDPLKKTESTETVIGDLAEKWSWQDHYRNLVFFLRKGVKWHDGHPFTSKDVKYTFDMVRGTKFAALQAGRLDVAFPGDATKTIAEQVIKAEPRIKMTLAAQNVNDNLLLNVTKPPFNNLKVRQAFSLSIDRRAVVQTVHQGGAMVGAAMAPKPWGVYGLLEKDLAALPGYGKGSDDKAKAKKLLAEAGFGPSNPLKLELATRAQANYLDFASFVINELKQIGVEGTLKQI